MSSFGSLSSLRMTGLCVRGCLLAQGFLIPVHAFFKCYTRAAKDIEGAANGEVDFAIGE